jgi:hypothetical protein
MDSSVRRFGVAALAGLAVCGALSSPAHAQMRQRPGTTTVVTPAPVVNPFLSPFFFQNRTVPFIPSLGAQSINRNPFLNEFTTLGQGAYNTAVLGQALSNIPPYLLGYSPYPQMINYGPSYPTISPYGGSTLSTTGGYNPYLGGGYGGATMTTSPYMAGASPSTAAYGGSPGYGSSGYGGYGYPYSINPYNGYLTGAADVTTANARYQLTTQQARLEREKANQEHMQTRRRIIEEAEWERGRMPDPERAREQDIETALSRARRDPPLTEVWSARSLNALLNHLASQPRGQLAKGPNVPLDEDALKSINLTAGDSRANAGLLKDDGKLQWPRPLQGDDFTENRTRLSRLLEEAVQKLKFNPNAPVPPGLLTDMRNDLDALNRRLNGSVGDLSPSQYIEARRYLNQVRDALAALSDPKAGACLNPSWAGKAKNVAELVNFLSRSGLRFAPATPGDEPAYAALYRALADFDAGMRQVAQRPALATPKE